MKLNNELNNMSWRVRPDEVLLEVGRLYGSKMGLQKLNVEVYTHIQYIIVSYTQNDHKFLFLLNRKTFTLIQQYQKFMAQCLNLSAFFSLSFFFMYT